MTQPLFLVIGHGYTASGLTPRLVARGWQVAGTTRGTSEGGSDGVAAAGATPILWPGDDAAIAAAISAASAILVTVPPTAGGDPALTALGSAIAASRPGWLGYLSATSVYGDSAGDWLDEDTVPAPSTARGSQRLAAENGWRTLAADHDVALMIFRLAGIYGPGRSAFDRLRDGTARRIIKPGQVFSRIHVDDIATAILAALDPPRPGAVWNLGDDLPAPPQDVIAHAAGLLGIPAPPEEPFEQAAATMSPMARSFYAENKRVANARIKRDLDLTLRHPDYRSGLAAILKAEADSKG